MNEVLSKRQRIDLLLVQRDLAPSRSRARDMVARNCVTVDGTTIGKPGLMVAQDAAIAINDPAQTYVSRAALKLIAGLDGAGFDISQCHCLDLGASTGGFTQVLLERGAAHVTALDVGHGQLAEKLVNDRRVTNIEGLNARDLTAEHLETAPQVLVSDVSFISLKLAAQPSLLLAPKNALTVLLVKPQFEVGKAGIGKGGIVSDESLIGDMLTDMECWFEGLPGWRMTHMFPSPIQGGDGNKEYLLCGMRDG